MTVIIRGFPNYDHNGQLLSSIWKWRKKMEKSWKSWLVCIWIPNAEWIVTIAYWGKGLLRWSWEVINRNEDVLNHLNSKPWKPKNHLFTIIIGSCDHSSNHIFWVFDNELGIWFSFIKADHTFLYRVLDEITKKTHPRHTCSLPMSLGDVSRIPGLRMHQWASGVVNLLLEKRGFHVLFSCWWYTQDCANPLSSMWKTQ